ncbi:PhzF family phenazine biosynthesis protein [Nonomuraea thailandensis]
MFASGRPYTGNALAVVVDGDGLSTQEMQSFARWTNLSETTFLLPPTTGRPTTGSASSPPTPSCPSPVTPRWAPATPGWRPGQARTAGLVVQECGAGLVHVDATDAGLAFRTPPLIRSGPVEEELLDQIVESLGITRDDVVDAEWIDNGPGWVGVLLQDAEAVLALRPRMVPHDIGVAGPYPEGSPCAFEVRAFFPSQGSTVEDPVTGSLNGSLAEWLLRTGRAKAPYVAAQGTAIGRAGRVDITVGSDDAVRVGGEVITCVTGHVEL